MSGDRFLKRGQLAHPAVRRRPAAQCLGCGDPVPRRRRWCVECATNRDTLAAKKRAYYERNRDTLAAKKRAYRERNRDTIAAKKRAYYERNRDTIAAKMRAYYERNRDTLAAKTRAYRERNRDTIAAKTRAYRERNRDTLAAKKRAQYRATHLCHRCGRPLEPQRGRPPRLCPKCRRKA